MNNGQNTRAMIALVAAASFNGLEATGHPHIGAFVCCFAAGCVLMVVSEIMG